MNADAFCRFYEYHFAEHRKIWDEGVRSLSDSLDPAAFKDRETIRACRDKVERSVRDHLLTSRDDMLFEKPFAEGEDKDIIRWRVLLQVANHGTDHRAQILRLLCDPGVKTESQDYIFYAYDTPL
jgi:uncharacterized damage-inducible protein DinB